MVEPEKPFACTMPDCGMTFTNEDHLNVHTKKHDMVLQFGGEQKVFVADQTPTPTRFIRNCEEVGLFQDLQNVNPFDEGFKRAIETKQGILSLEQGCTSTEDLHTPQMFPLLDPGDSVFCTTNNHRNITISRSSSDETGAIKEFETTRISKLTNEVTTISRIVEKHDDTPKTKDSLQKNSVSYTNNIIKIQSNVEIIKDTDVIEDTVIKDAIVTKDCIIKDSIVKDVYDRLQVEVPPIMSQKSIDFVVDSLTTDCITEYEKSVKDSASLKDVKVIKDSRNVNVKSMKEDSKNAPDKKTEKDEYEVILKLPSGQQIKLVNAESKGKQKSTKDLLKKVLTEKVESQKILNSVSIIPNVIPTITSGTLIPVSIVNTNLVNNNLVTTNLVNNNLVTTSLVNNNLVNTNLANNNLVNTSLVNSNLVTTNLVNTNLVTRNLVNTNRIPKLPLKVFDKKTVKRKCPEGNHNIKSGDSKKVCVDTDLDQSNVSSDTISKEKWYSIHKQRIVNDLDSRSAASRRYRAKLKESMSKQAQENKQLKKVNERLSAEKAALKTLIIEHMRRCHCADDLRELQEKISSIETKD